MYPRNAASPERIAIGAVVQISDGAVQTSGVSVAVLPQGGVESSGGGTLEFNGSGQALYTPTQGETNHTSFIVTAYKTGCFPVSQTVVTTASVTPGRVILANAAHGGSSATFQTQAGVISQESTAGATETASGAAATAAGNAETAAGNAETAAGNAETAAGNAALAAGNAETAAGAAQIAAGAAQAAAEALPSVQDMVEGGIALQRMQKQNFRKNLVGILPIANGIASIEWEGDPWPEGAGIELTPNKLVDSGSEGWIGSWPQALYKIISVNGVPTVDGSYDPGVFNPQLSAFSDVLGICSYSTADPATYPAKGRLKLTGTGSIGNNRNTVIINTTGAKIECAFINLDGDQIYETGSIVTMSDTVSQTAKATNNSNFLYCDGWSGAVNPVVEFSSNHGGAMDEASHMQYCIQYKTPSGDIRMLGYWNTYSGWDQRMGENDVCPPGSILCFCADNGSPDPAADLMFIPGRTLVMTPKTPGIDQTPKTLWIGEMTLAHQSGLKHCFSADGVMKDLNLITIPATQNGTVESPVTPEQINALIEALGMVASHQYHPGTIVNPVETQNKDFTLYCNTDYDDVRFNVGAQWATYLNEADVEVWFTIWSGKTVLLTVQGEIEDANAGDLLLDLTAAQTNVRPGTYDWQYMLRRPITVGDDPPVTTVKRRMMMDGKVYMKPSFRA